MTGPLARTTTAPTLLAQTAWILGGLRRVAAIWGSRRLDQKLRKQAMLAVAQAMRKDHLVQLLPAPGNVAVVDGLQKDQGASPVTKAGDLRGASVPPEW